MKRILITGGSGLLGQYLNVTASVKYNLFTIFNNNHGNCSRFNSKKSDIRNRNDLIDLFETIRPEIVIHCAALTNTISYDLKNYFETNVRATQNIAELCQKYKAKLIYISTDLVYAGYRGSFLKEDAKLIPASVYAETKLMGEVKIKETFDNYLIIRTALLYGLGLNHSRCHFHNIFNDLKEGKTVKLFTDQFRTPVSLNDASRLIVEFAGTDLNGETINLGGSERVSRYQLGELLCSITGYNKNLLEKITMNDVHGLPKVEDVSLNIDKLLSLGFKPRSIKENILEIIRQ
jgi:dTDP-4-dehydrorhamnose reductase